MKKVIYQAKKSKQTKKKGRVSFAPLIFGVLILLLLPPLIYQILYFDKISPGIYISGINLSGLSKDEAVNLLSQEIKMPTSIKLINQTQTFTFYTKDVKASYDLNKTVDQAFALTRTNNFMSDLHTKTELLFTKKNLGIVTAFEDEEISKFISVIAGQDSIEPVMPTIKILKGGIQVTKGLPGKEVDKTYLLKLITDNLSFALSDDIQIPVISIDNTLSDQEVLAIKNRAEKYLGSTIQLKFEFKDFTFKDTELINFLNPKGGFNTETIDGSLEKIISQVNRDPQNPKFVFDNGKVTEFSPSMDGIKVDKNKLKDNFLSSLEQIEKGQKTQTIDIPVERNPSSVSTGSVNNLGIKELIGRGTSTFYHSIPSRVHNVVLAASKINGTLVAPGETFSFNNTLGDVSQFTGYQQAYIISEGKTILGDGGGVCQVSTTLFRALLNGGLPITDRTAHAYRVGYYEQNSPPGLDATVYGPSPDLKFTNDTQNYILIEAVANPKSYSLIFELYGTSDGRISTISKPIVSNVTPALPTVYQDDPTMRLGTTKQTDFSAKGARVTFKYLVTRNGETLIDRTFVSNYKPWAAVYLRGTAPAI